MTKERKEVRTHKIKTYILDRYDHISKHGAIKLVCKDLNCSIKEAVRAYDQIEWDYI